MNKIREILSDDKHDWEQRVVAVSDVTLEYLILDLNSVLVSMGNVI